jgi:hypothetical protein
MKILGLLLGSWLMLAPPAVWAARPVRLLVKWASGPASPAAQAGNAQVGGAPERAFPCLGWQTIRLPEGLSVADGLRAYRRLPGVVAVEADGAWGKWEPPRETEAERAAGPRKRTVDAVAPNDPRFADQWYLSAINAPAAWQTTTGGAKVVVAVIDTGVDYNHPDLAANMWVNPGETGWDASGRDKATNGVDDDGDGYVDDVHGADVTRQTGDPMDQGVIVGTGDTIYHGTLGAGLIGAVGNNGLGIAGVNWSTRILAIRVAGSDPADLRGNSDLPFYRDVVAAYEYVLALKQRGVNVRVTSNSFSSFTTGLALEDALSALAAEGILNVFSAGNDSVDYDLYTRFPAGLNNPTILNVASTAKSGARASFSNYGRGTVDLAAPGIDILSTSRGETYASASGTSFSCPLVAGAAALLLAWQPELTPSQVKAALLGSVDPHASLQGEVLSNGRLNLGRALEYLSDTNPPAIVVNAFPAGRRTRVDAPVQVEFNRPMNPASVEAAFALSPPVAGRFAWAADHRSFQFLHDAPFDPTTNYLVRIGRAALDEAGGYLDGGFNHNHTGSDLSWTFCFPVANDDCANAQPLAGAAGEVAGDNRYAIWEVGEPQGDEVGARIRGNTVWYRWTPSASGWHTFRLTEAEFDPLLDVFSGDQIDDLVSVAANDDDGANPLSRVTFYAVTGAVYSLRVSGKNAFDPSQSGAFKLRWYPLPPPALAEFTPTRGAPGAAVTLKGTDFSGALAVLFNGASAWFTNGAAGDPDVSITTVVPPEATSGPITLVTAAGQSVSAASFQVLPPPLTVTRAANGALRLDWESTNPAVVLEISPDLNAGDWTPATQIPVRASGLSTVTLYPATSPRFFRLRGE